MLNENKNFYDKKRFVLPLLLFFYPIGVILLFVGKSFPIMKTKLIVGGAFGVFFLFMVGSTAMEIAEIGSQTKKMTALIDDHLKNGSLEEALIEITNYTSKYSSPEMEERKKQIEKAMSLDEVESTLATMDNERFEKLQNGTLNEPFFEEKALNDHFIKQLKANSDKREGLIANYEVIKQQKQAAGEKALREEKIESSFSKYDGSHRGLVKHVENIMNDPDSFEHVETTYLDKGNHLLVRMKYRGTNSFGAKVLGTVTAICDFDGNVLSTEQ